MAKNVTQKSDRAICFLYPRQHRMLQMTWKHPIICSFARVSLWDCIAGWFTRAAGAAHGRSLHLLRCSGAKAHHRGWRRCFLAKQWLVVNTALLALNGGDDWRWCESWAFTAARVCPFSGSLSAPHAQAAVHSQEERAVSVPTAKTWLKVKSGGTMSDVRGLTKAGFTGFFTSH